MTSKKRPRLTSPPLLCLLVFALIPVASAEWKEKVLHSFQGAPDGATPAGGVVFDAGGNMYGATTDGGAFGCAPTQCGTVFQVAPPAKNGDPWTEAALYVFKGNSSGDGNTPAGGVVIDSSGNLYGTTAYGGTGNCVLVGGTVGCGTVFELSPPAQKGGAWTETVLYSFQGGKDGYLPSGDLVFDSKGNLYGATQYGGGYGSCNAPFYPNCGAVFELSPPQTKGGAWTEQVLYSFKGTSPAELLGDGANPNGGLLLDSQGAIYGTTSVGGINSVHCSFPPYYFVGCGTVFKLSPPGKKSGTWTESMVHLFTGGIGATPSSGLTFDGNGALYGTGGGGRKGLGSVFRIAPAKNEGWVETVLYSFTGGSDGNDPWGPVTFDSLGNLYGSAHGGVHFSGTLFRLKSNGQKGWAFSVGYSFGRPPDGTYPVARLVFGSDGALYSTTQGGGSGQGCQGGCGTVFRISPK